MNKEAGRIVFHTEHVKHDMNDVTGERTKKMHNTTGEWSADRNCDRGENAEADAEGIERTSTETMLSDAVKGVKNIQGIKSAKKRVLITNTKNVKRKMITCRKGIANVFKELILQQIVNSSTS